MLPLGQPTCLTMPREGMSPFQMNVTGKLWAMSRRKFRTMRADSRGNATVKIGAMRAECRNESLDQYKTPDSLIVNPG